VGTSGAGLTDLAAQIVHVTRLLGRGHVQEALDVCRRLLLIHPEDPEVLHYLGLGHLKQHDLVPAEHYLTRALLAAPMSASVLNELGIVRLKQGAHEQALDHFSRALDIDAFHSDALNNIVTTFSMLQQPGRAKSYVERLTRVLPLSVHVHVMAAENSLARNDIEQAIRRGRKAVRLAPHHAPARLVLADALEAGGRFKQAKFHYLSILARDPGELVSLSKLLSLKGTHVSEKHAHEARRLASESALNESDRVALHLGLARYYDQRREYDLAFQHLGAGTRVRFEKHPFDRTLHSKAVERLIHTFTPSVCRSLPAHEVKSTRPIFIVGMPRSGTTLVEQILASHSQIEAGGELPTIITIAAQMSHAGFAYPEKMPDLDPQALGRMAQQYLEKLADISADAARVTDKMPFNFMHLGLIVGLFPNAKIIHCRRNALDTCVSCFFTSFTESLQFASDLETLGSYYLDYWQLMRHWRAALPVKFLEVDYERVVGDTRSSVEELLAFCEVEWEEACLQFHRTERGVRTPSRWQVRQPIYGHSVGRWRHYEKHLRPLVEILSPTLREDATRALG
jgi:Flp pilus assembly protein TadD